MKLEINVPSHQSEITLGQYKKFLKIAESNPEGSFIDAKMIEIFCGIPLSDAYELKMSSVQAIVDIISELLSQTPDHVERFTMDGIVYGFIPDLDNMSFGEHISIETNIANWQQMHVAMRALYRPIVSIYDNLYNIEKYDTNNAHIMDEMPLDAALGSIFFLFDLGIELSTHTLTYSLTQEEKKAIQEKLISEQNGAGINQFSLSLTAILKDLKISLN